MKRASARLLAAGVMHPFQVVWTDPAETRDVVGRLAGTAGVLNERFTMLLPKR